MRTECGEWLGNMLFQRDELRSPDGRELYRYRLSEPEFAKLERLLQNWIKITPYSKSLDKLALDSLFCQLFVLYGAEWWRRRYDGSGFSWEPILNDLRADPDAWSAARRSNCIVTGLKRWDIKIRSHGGLRYIISVALQGGLPLRLLAEGRGAIGKVLHRVLSLARESAVTPQDIQGWVESLQAHLPQTYRQPAIYILLTDVVVTVLRLKQQANLTSGEDAIALLEQKVPGWREQFPLPLENEHAQGLVEQLVRDVAVVRMETQIDTLLVVRCLEQSDSSEEWSLRSILELPDTLAEKQLTNLFGMTTEQVLPRTMDLRLNAGQDRMKTSLRRLAGHEKYRVRRTPWGFHDNNSIQEHILQLNAPDGRIWLTPARGGEELDEELPWVFSAAEPFHLLRQSGGKIAEKEVLLALSPEWNIAASSETGAEIEELGLLGSSNRKVRRVRGSIQVLNTHGDTWRIRTGRADATEECYTWHGNRLWLDFQSPAMAFRGQPTLYKISRDGDQRQVSGTPCFRACNGHAVATSGPVIARFPAEGEIRHRSRMVLLPADAAFSLQSRDAVSGAIHLYNWGATNAIILSSGVGLTLKNVDKNLMLNLSVNVGAPSPEKVQIEIFWPRTTTAVRLYLPFPARGVRAFDAAGKELPRDNLLTVQQLLGTRIIIQTGQRDNTHTRLDLCSVPGGVIRSYPLAVTPSSARLELRLHDYTEDIQQLLSANNELDAEVRVEIVLDGIEHFRLKVSRYAARLKPDNNSVMLNNTAMQTVDIGTLSALRVLAINMVRPGDDPIVLPQMTSEGVACGIWPFAPETRDPGPWLLYPAKDESLALRPLLWTVLGETETESQFAQAMCLPDQLARQRELDRVIAGIADNFLELTWIEIEQLAGQVGHLSLTTLDIWLRLANSPDGMAALALRLGELPSGFVRRFAIELPFSWEVVPFMTWRQAMASLRLQCVEYYGDQAGTSFRAKLNSVIGELSVECNALDYLLGIARSCFDEKERQSAELLRICIGPQAAIDLFQGDNCHLQKLMRNHACEQWPNGCEELIQQARMQPDIAPYLCPESHGFHDLVINLPLILAAQCATGQSGQWLKQPANVHSLRECKAFDPDWFSEAYNLTIARCFSDGLFACE